MGPWTSCSRAHGPEVAQCRAFAHGLMDLNCLNVKLARPYFGCNCNCDGNVSVKWFAKGGLLVKDPPHRLSSSSVALIPIDQENASNAMQKPKNEEASKERKRVHRGLGAVRTSAPGIRGLDFCYILYIRPKGRIMDTSVVKALMNKEDKIYVAGHAGLVGAAIVRKLHREGYLNLVMRTHKELDLTRQQDVENFFLQEKPLFVIVAAAKVGGIYANNTYPADFIGINLQIQTNVIDAAYKSGVKKLLFLGSSCIYPKFASQPIEESSLLTGPLEPTNEWYAIAKIAGIKMCQAYRIQYSWDAISGMPTNLYGPHDNFHPENSHVLPALIRRFHEAKVLGSKEVVVWGTGSPLREFLHVDDLADAVLFLMLNYSEISHINVGSGKEVTIKELAELVKEIVGYEGHLTWDSSKPDGTPRKLMDNSKLEGLGWHAKISLREGLVGTYKWYVDSYGK
ncbi:hypothetical protein L7F22_001454 [Adiantum nelumboides]|nr:hypothetical protein [Adiantum nelumboides]